MRKIFDPLHGFIVLNDLESALVDTAPFQRLRYIRQLGSAYLVYPGATHTRFEHSLGTMELASRIFDHVLLSEDNESWLSDPAYARQIVRLAALCHDLGHLPFSHVAEALVLGAEGHERWTVAIIQSDLLETVWHEVRKRFPGHDVQNDLIKLAVGKSKLKQLGFEVHFSKWHEALGQIIAGDFFGADRIDYLLRDARNTGVSYGLFDYHQLIEMVRIIPGVEGQLEMGIEEGGIEACEALLLARHFMHRRVYQYDSVKSQAFHLGRFIAAVLGPDFAKTSLNNYLSWTDNEILTLLRASLDNQESKGYEDAVCLSDRTKRFRAVNVLKMPEILAEFPKGQIFWEEAHGKKGIEKTFPVLRRNREIIPSKNILQVHIPARSSTWLYVAPELFNQVSQFI